MWGPSGSWKVDLKEVLVKEEIPKGVIFSLQEEALPIVKEILEDFRPDEIIKQTPKTFIFRKDVNKTSFFVKSYAPPTGLRKVQEFLTSPRVFKIIKSYLVFSSAGFKTLVPLGGWSFRNPGRGWPSGLIFPWLPPEKKAARVIRHVRNSLDLLQSYVRDLIRYIQRMHQAGFYLRDPKVSNFFILPEGVLLVDLDSLRRFKGPVPFRKQKQNFEVLIRSLERVGVGKARELVFSLIKN